MTVSDNSHLPDPLREGKRFLKHHEVVWAIQMEAPFTINLLERFERGMRGDYLVRGEHGELTSIPEHQFQVNYYRQDLHPSDHEPEWEPIDIDQPEEPEEEAIEGRLCRKCGYMQAKEIIWNPAGWRTRVK